jgi:ankyrin repeat protein
VNFHYFQLLIEAGGLVNAEDHEGNMPLHVKCYGETDKPSEIACIELLLENKVKMTARNHRVCAFEIEI